MEQLQYDLRQIDLPLLIKQRQIIGNLMVNSKELTENEKVLLNGLWELLHDIQDRFEEADSEDGLMADIQEIQRRNEFDGTGQDEEVECESLGY